MERFSDDTFALFDIYCENKYWLWYWELGLPLIANHLRSLHSIVVLKVLSSCDYRVVGSRFVAILLNIILTLLIILFLLFGESNVLMMMHCNALFDVKMKTRTAPVTEKLTLATSVTPTVAATADPYLMLFCCCIKMLRLLINTQGVALALW